MAKRKKKAIKARRSLNEISECHTISVLGIAKDGKKYVAEFDAVFPSGTEMIEVREKLQPKDSGVVSLRKEAEALQKMLAEAQTRMMKFLKKIAKPRKKN